MQLLRGRFWPTLLALGPSPRPLSTLRGRLRAVCSATGADADGFDTLGISPELLMGLQQLGFEKPTEIQRRAFPVIRSGEDAVLLDETGTGKTLAYVLPVLQSMLDERAGLADAGLADELGSPSDREDDGESAGSQAMLLVPNRDLCVQVLATIQPLLNALPFDLEASALTESGAWGDADIVISTPAIALRSWDGLARRRALRGPDRVRWLVLDEADQLLAGSFKPAQRSQYPIERIIQSLKSEAKRNAQGDDRRGQSKLRQEVREAGSKERREEARLNLRRALATRWASKQFVLVGATMPNAGTRNLAGYVETKFPSASWVRTGREHRKLAALRHYFVKVDASQRGEALRHAVVHGPQGRAIVFANTLLSAAEAFEQVEPVRKAALFHKDVAPEVRTELLQRFQEGELPLLVCTGLASRGIDFADVAHVIQYELAPNAVEFMHRVGRTARAGKAGVATNLYGEEGEDLAEALRQAIEGGDSIEHTFSRKRSFRKTIKRYGKPHYKTVTPPSS